MVEAAAVREASEPGRAADAAPAGVPPSLVRTWQAVVVCLAAAALVLVAARGRSDLRIVDIFLRADLPVLAAEGVILLLIARWAATASPRLEGWCASWRVSGRTCAAACLLVLAAGLAGWRWVFRGYPLSYDEFMAAFDATTFRHGALVAHAPATWRAFVPALLPYSGLEAPGHAVWGSDYLPLNAVLQALGQAFGTPALAGAVLSVASVWLTFSIARKRWPDRPDAAAIAALLLASSSQLLVTGMTLYAMPAHLALNLLWLRLYQEDRRWSDGAALAVGWAACGLHQMVFHPLFVAPFIVQAAWERRWGRAVAFAAGYAAILLFWIMYFPTLFHSLGLPPALGKAGGPQAFVGHVLQLLGGPDLPQAPRFMAEDLLRFLSWQNPLMAALLLALCLSVKRASAFSRSLLAGMGLTLAAAALLMPDPGHGWGYRYLHGFLGAACLVATEAYLQLTAQDWPPATARRALALSVLLSLAVLVPWRIAQAYALTTPYLRAHRQIAADHAPVVLLDGRGLAYADDLVRNTPDVSNRPVVADVTALTPQMADDLCRRGPVHVFDAQDGRPLGLLEAAVAGPADAHRAEIRARMRARGCAVVHVAKP